VGKCETIVIMHREKVANPNSPPAFLLRQSYREDGKVRKGTLANLSKLADDTIVRTESFANTATPLFLIENLLLRSNVLYLTVTSPPYYAHSKISNPKQ
jgi:hypothetical protein